MYIAMPTEIKLLPAQNLLFVRCFGRVTPDDIIGWNVDNRIFPDANQNLVILVDLAGVSEADMSFSHINDTYAHLKRHYAARQERLHLLLYAPNDLAFGLARIMQSLSLMSDTLRVDLLQSEAEFPRLLPKLGESFGCLRDKAISPPVHLLA